VPGCGAELCEFVFVETGGYDDEAVALESGF